MRSVWLFSAVLLLTVTTFCTLRRAAMASTPALRVVFVTTPSEEVATKLARSVVESKLAACVNIVPGIKSIYEWEGAIHEDAEHLLIIKTTEASVSPLRARLLELHPYDTPEFVALPVTEEAAKYADWVRSQTAATASDK